MNRPKITQYLAIFVTLTACAIAATAAWQRAGTNWERGLLVFLSVAVCVGAHLLPAITRRKLGWLLWVLCLMATVYAHICFVTYAGQHANQLRGEMSILSTGTREQIDATRQALSAIKSRSVSVISAEIATTDNWRIRRALFDELKEARKAQSYRDDLIRLQGVAMDAKTTTGIDIVTGRIASVTGSSEASITLIISLILAVLLELFGALLWLEVLHPSGMFEPARQSDPLKALRADVKAGKLKPTVKAIRLHLGCSQVRAMAVRKEYFSAKGAN
jgi:hypothetical protein